MDDFALPSLAPHLKLNRAPDAKGEPQWTIHNPVANTYFKIDWVAFECLARFPLYKNAVALKEAVEHETTLSMTLDQIADIAAFLQQNNLTAFGMAPVPFRAGKKQPFWKKLLHTYLYVTIPLFQPQEFLDRVYPKIAFMFTRAFVMLMLMFFVGMAVWTLPRIDEFFHTFHQFFSLEGAAATLLVLGFVKIVHEFAHAFTAVQYGVKVPHMGVALIVMYPVLYTETSGSWALPSRSARFHIGIAGITAELILAGLFLALWHIAPAGGILQSLCFLVVCVSLVGSLLVNLNPLMRFDGYYMLSDVSGFDNLQHRAIAFARHRLREILFGLNDPPPEDLKGKDIRFLTAFGAALLFYRFFLFLGIAFLVYHVFFQPLGFFLMMVELSWFIFLPVWSELKIWWAKREAIQQRRRSLVPAFVILAALLVVLVPWRSHVMLPAVLHAGEYRAFYAPAPSEITAVNVRDGDTVEEGQTLATLRSPDLEFKLRTARQELQSLETLRRRGQADPTILLDPSYSDAAIEQARVKVAALEDQKTRLIITAPFGGIVRDLNMELQAGRFIRTDEKLFVLINPQSGSVATAYAPEDVSADLQNGTAAVFVSNGHDTRLRGLSLALTSATGQSAIDWPELTSPFGGPVAADMGQDGHITPRRSLYMVQTGATPEQAAQVRVGYLQVDTAPDSIFISFIKWFGSLIRQEAKLG